MSTAQYRIVSPAGAELESGTGDVSVADGGLVLSPGAPGAPGALGSSAGSVLRVPFAHISSVTEPQPFTVLVTLADGNAIELSRLGTMRTQLLAELRDGRGDDAAAAASAVGKAETFCGAVGDGGLAGAEIRVYEDALLVLADNASTASAANASTASASASAASAAAERISFSFIDAVQAQDYAVTVSVAGRGPVVLSRLGRRTDELVSLLADRLREARGRTAAFLGALLPGLDPMALRSAAGLLRDGVAVPARTLDGIHPELASTLLRVATLPDRHDPVAALTQEAELSIGFKQLASVRKAAVGVTPWRDPAVAPHIGEHESPGGLFGSGLRGALGAEMASRVGPGGGFAGLGGFGGGFGGYGYGGYGGFGGYGGYGGYGGPFGEIGGGYGAWGAAWALRALGAGTNAGQSRPMAPRANVTRGLLTPETEDLSALTAAGDNPTVLAFALCRGSGGRVAYEALNVPEPMTFVYETEAVTTLNRALDDAGFHPAAVHAQGLTEPARPGARASLLARAFVAQVPHDADWARVVAGLLAGAGAR